MIREFEFNTGVRPNYHPSDGGPPHTLFGPHQRWRRGTKVILFYADVPEGATFLFACDYNALPESKEENIVVAPITGGLLSKFGYFRLSLKT